MRLKQRKQACTRLDRRWGFQEAEVPRYHEFGHMKVVRLSAQRTGRLRKFPSTIFCYRLRRPQGNSAAGRIMSMKNSNDSIGIKLATFRFAVQRPPPTIKRNT